MNPVVNVNWTVGDSRVVASATSVAPAIRKQPATFTISVP